MRRLDEKWADVARKSILRTKKILHETVRQRLVVLLQWDTMNGLVDKEARGMVRRWRGMAEEDGKKSELARIALH